jgi:hypothetical protein
VVAAAPAVIGNLQVSDQAKHGRCALSPPLVCLTDQKFIFLIIKVTEADVTSRTFQTHPPPKLMQALAVSQLQER